MVILCLIFRWTREAFKWFLSSSISTASNNIWQGSCTHTGDSRTCLVGKWIHEPPRHRSLTFWGPWVLLLLFCFLKPSASLAPMTSHLLCLPPPLSPSSISFLFFRLPCECFLWKPTMNAEHWLWNPFQLSDLNRRPGSPWSAPPWDGDGELPRWC